MTDDSLPSPPAGWTRQDVKDEILAAELCEALRASPGISTPVVLQARAAATRFRLRATRIARLLEHGAIVAESWYPARLMLDPIPSTAVSPDEGPFTGERIVVRNPPRPLWVALNPAGEAVIRYVVPEEFRPTPPRGGRVLGHYAWNEASQALVWCRFDPHGV